MAGSTASSRRLARGRRLALPPVVTASVTDPGVVLIEDVITTGDTLAHALQPFAKPEREGRRVVWPPSNPQIASARVARTGAPE